MLRPEVRRRRRGAASRACTQRARRYIRSRPLLHPAPPRQVSRTLTFGEKGVSGGQFSQFLSTIALNAEPVDWAAEDLTYLGAAVWDADMKAAVAAATPVAALDAFFSTSCDAAGGGTRDVAFRYSGLDGYAAVAHRFSYLDDAKAGGPRTAYNGVVVFPHQGCRKFVVPA